MPAADLPLAVPGVPEGPPLQLAAPAPWCAEPATALTRPSRATSTSWSARGRFLKPTAQTWWRPASTSSPPGITSRWPMPWPGSPHRRSGKPPPAGPRARRRNGHRPLPQGRAGPGRATAVRAAAIGLDISKFALRRAARLNPEALNVVGDVWQPLPVADERRRRRHRGLCAAQRARVRPGARARAAAWWWSHRGPATWRRLPAGPGCWGSSRPRTSGSRRPWAGTSRPCRAADLDLALALGPRDVARLAFMGPAGHHLDRAALAALEAALPPRTSVSARFRISVFEPIR